MAAGFQRIRPDKDESALLAVTGQVFRRMESVVPFEIDAGLAAGIGADIGLDLDVRGELDFDRGGAAAGRRALLRANEDAAGHIATGAEAGRGGGIALPRLDVQPVEAKALADLVEHAGPATADTGDLGHALGKLHRLERRERTARLPEQELRQDLVL